MLFHISQSSRAFFVFVSIIYISVLESSDTYLAKDAKAGKFGFEQGLADRWGQDLCVKYTVKIRATYHWA